ncbi:MAG: hypothetical protein ACJ72Z_12520, partial [Pyrinomonadaceae bacterium]
GKMDFAVQRSGVFYRLFTSGISISQTPFGNPNDFVVPGDYDGDGKSDLCVVGASSAFTSEAGEPAMQWTYRPSSGGPDVVQNWGFINDTPVPGDYNGDGRSDFAIWRFGALSTFWILRSNTYQIESRQWGLLDDIPVNFTFVN